MRGNLGYNEAEQQQKADVLVGAGLPQYIITSKDDTTALFERGEDYLQATRNGISEFTRMLEATAITAGGNHMIMGLW